MHEGGGATADPVGVVLVEPFHAGNDEAALGGVVRQVGGAQAPLSGQGLGLLEGEPVAAHQHLQSAVTAEPHHHANAGQVVADLLPHRDAVGAAVLRGRRFQVVVDAVQPADEGVVEGGALGGEFAVAEVHPAVMADPDEGALAGSGAVAATPDAGSQLQIPERDGDLAAIGIDMALVHRARHIGQGGGVAIGLLLAVPTLQQIDAHLAGVEIEGVHLRIRSVAEGQPIGGKCAVVAAALLRQRRCDRHQEGQGPYGHADGEPALAPPQRTLATRRTGQTGWRWRRGGLQDRQPDGSNLRAIRCSPAC